MIETISQARDEMFQMLLNAWNADPWTNVIGGEPTILWQGRDEGTSPPLEKPYVRVSAKHAIGQQETLSDEDGVRLWQRLGVLFVQCFGTLPSGRALEDAEYMAQVAQRAYQGKQSESCIWFRNATIAEIGPTDGWYQVNMTVQFDYSEGR